MIQRTSLVIVFATALATIGCCPGFGAFCIDEAIAKYEQEADQIELGDSKSTVLSILGPSQSGLEASERKRPEKYVKNGVKVEIYYFRSARQPDGLTTDDEFTPYLFNDDKLVGIGWQVLGGPKTQGQAKSDTYISNKTTVKTTIVY